MSDSIANDPFFDDLISFCEKTQSAVKKLVQQSNVPVILRKQSAGDSSLKMCRSILNDISSLTAQGTTLVEDWTHSNNEFDAYLNNVRLRHSEQLAQFESSEAFMEQYGYVPYAKNQVGATALPTENGDVHNDVNGDGLNGDLQNGIGVNGDDFDESEASPGDAMALCDKTLYDIGVSTATVRLLQKGAIPKRRPPRIQQPETHPDDSITSSDCNFIRRTSSAAVSNRSTPKSWCEQRMKTLTLDDSDQYEISPQIWVKSKSKERTGSKRKSISLESLSSPALYGAGDCTRMEMLSRTTMAAASLSDDEQSYRGASKFNIDDIFDSPKLSVYGEALKKSMKRNA